MQRGQKCVRSFARMGGGGENAQGVITNGQVFVVDNYWVHKSYQLNENNFLYILIGFGGLYGNFGGVGMMIYANDLAMASSFTSKHVNEKHQWLH